LQQEEEDKEEEEKEGIPVGNHYLNGRLWYDVSFVFVHAVR